MTFPPDVEKAWMHGIKKGGKKKKTHVYQQINSFPEAFRDCVSYTRAYLRWQKLPFSHPYNKKKLLMSVIHGFHHLGTKNRANPKVLSRRKGKIRA